MPLDDVAQLLVRWREAGGLFERRRVLSDGIELLRGLDPAERTALARSAVELGAPDLAARIARGTDGAVSTDQLLGIADDLLSLDDRQVEQLAATLRDPAARERLVREAVTAGLGEATEVVEQVALGSDDAAPHLPPPGATRTSAAPDDGPPAIPVAARDLTGTAGLHALARGEIPLDDVALGDQALDHPGLAEIGLVDTTLHDVGLHAAPPPGTTAEDEGPRADPPPDGGGADDAAATLTGAVGPTGRSAAAVAATVAGERDTDRQAHARDVPDRDDQPHAGDDPDHDDQPHADDGRARPDDPAPTTVDARRLVDALRRATSSTARVALTSPTRLAGLGTDQVLQVLDAVPAGWQRRRLARRLLDAGVLADVPVVMLLRRFPASADRTFVVGWLLDAGTVDLGDVADHMPPRTARRLATRAGR